jgi:hypothetical protein
MMVRVPAGQGAVLYVADDRDLAPRPYDRSSARAHVDVASFREGDAGLRDRLAADGAAGAGLEQHRAVYRIEIDAQSNAAVSVHLALGGVPMRAIGRATRVAASGTPVLFGVALDGLLRTPDRTSEVLLMGRDDQAQLTGAGWSDAERHSAGPFRWMTSPEADLVLPITMSEPRALSIQAVATGDTRESSLQLAFDGHELSAQALRDGWHTYDWALPAALVVPRIAEVTVRHVTPAGAGRTRARVGIGDVRVLGAP